MGIISPTYPNCPSFRCSSPRSKEPSEDFSGFGYIDRVHRQLAMVVVNPVNRQKRVKRGGDIGKKAINAPWLIIVSDFRTSSVSVETASGHCVPLLSIVCSCRTDRSQVHH